MLKIICFLFFFAIPVVCASQQITLTGRVSIHNSKYKTGTIEYVKDAYVSAFAAKNSNTDNEGRFELDFVGIKSGVPVKVEVDKAGLVVVNEYELREVIIGRTPPIKVYLTTKGELLTAQTELYNISKEALFSQKDALIARLKNDKATSKAAIEELEKKYAKEIANSGEAIALLNSEVAQLEKRLPEFAQNLAAQNLDFASDNYIKAYEFFKKGKIEKVIEVLDSDALDKAYKKGQIARAELNKQQTILDNTRQQLMQQNEQFIKDYDLLANSHILLFNYNEAANQYDKIIRIYLENNLNTFELSRWYYKASSNYFFAGKHQKALEYQLKEINIIQSFTNPQNSLLAESYTNIAVTYRELGDYNTALNYQKKAIQLLENEFGQDTLSLAIPYYAIAGTFSYLGNSEETTKYYEKALAIYLKNPSYDRDNLAVLYGNRAVHFISIGQFEKALESRKKGLEILEQIREPNDPLLISFYSSLGANYNYLGNNEKALEYELKSIADFEKIYKPEHPELLTAYNNIGATFYNMENYEKALEYQNKATLGREKILPPQHPSLFTSYRNVANSYFEIGNYDAAIEYYLKALSIKNKAYTNTNDDMLFEIYANLSKMYQSKEEYGNALIYEQKIIPYVEKNFNDNDLNLAASYYNIGNVYIYLRKFSEAIFYKEKEVKILKNQLDKHDQILIDTIQLLDLLKEKVKQQKK